MSIAENGVKMSQETYNQNVARLVRSLSMPNRHSELLNDLSSQSKLSSVKMFVDGNLDKRLDKVGKQLEFVAEAFGEDFEALIVEYINDLPLEAYDTGASDGQRMLIWLAEKKPLTPEQKDYVACQQARHAIEDIARVNRLRHTRFTELHSLAEQHSGELYTNDQLKILLNPIRHWTRFHSSALLDDQAPPPVDVMFFAAGNEIATAVLDLEGQALINELADYQPCTLGQWAALSQLADHQQLLDLCVDLSQMGLVAFA